MMKVEKYPQWYSVNATAIFANRHAKKQPNSLAFIDLPYRQT